MGSGPRSWKSDDGCVAIFSVIVVNSRVPSCFTLGQEALHLNSTLYHELNQIPDVGSFTFVESQSFHLSQLRPTHNQPYYRNASLRYFLHERTICTVCIFII